MYNFVGNQTIIEIRNTSLFQNHSIVFAIIRWNIATQSWAQSFDIIFMTIHLHEIRVEYFAANTGNSTSQLQFG